MKKQTLMKLFLLPVLLLVGGVCFIRLNESYYQSKFANVVLQTDMATVKKHWGTPDKEFFYLAKNGTVLQYHKGVLGWNTYIFIFGKENGLLNEKYIDD